MSKCALIINTGSIEHVHGAGLAGSYTIPAKPPGLPFSLLVVYPVPEIQDTGDGRKEIHWPKPPVLARDIVGLNSDCNRTRFGVLLCEATPTFPESLEQALENEMLFLNENRPKVVGERKGNSIFYFNEYKPGHEEQIKKLSAEIVKQRDAFHAECRKLVTAQEIAKAKNNWIEECRRLVAEGDMLFSKPQERQNIMDIHRTACIELNQEREWCYRPKVLVDCEGCGTPNKPGIAVCPQCGAVLDREKAARLGLIESEGEQASIPSQARRNR